MTCFIMPMRSLTTRQLGRDLGIVARAEDYAKHETLDTILTDVGTLLVTSSNEIGQHSASRGPIILNSMPPTTL